MRIENMKSILFTWALVAISAFVASCSEDLDAVTTDSEWTLPSNEILDGGPGKDGIPSIDNPIFSNISAVDGNIPDGNLVVVVKSGEAVRAYPHNILDWHEIVNDDFQGLSLALTYCPLTGTAIGWNREIDGTVTTFGVSGLLYNSNLIPYDRVTDSYWSQMLNESVSGERINQRIVTYPVGEMTFGAFKAHFPEGQVLTQNTGFDRSYERYPYGNYLTEESTLFPVSRRDDRIFGKERVLGIQHESVTRVYQLSHFEQTNVLVDEFSGVGVVLFGNAEDKFAAAFYNKDLNGETLIFQSFDGPNGVVATDQFENQWNLFGEVTAGPNVGETLEATASYIGFYFAWVAFNEEVQIFSGN